MYKRSIYNIKLNQNDNRICLAAAIIIAKAYITDMNEYNFLTYEPNYSDMINASRPLCTAANVELTNGGGIDEIIKLLEFTTRCSQYLL